MHLTFYLGRREITVSSVHPISRTFSSNDGSLYSFASSCFQLESTHLIAFTKDLLFNQQMKILNRVEVIRWVSAYNFKNVRHGMMLLVSPYPQLLRLMSMAHSLPKFMITACLLWNHCCIPAHVHRLIFLWRFECWVLVNCTDRT